MRASLEKVDVLGWNKSFLTSSLVLACFYDIDIQHSVRAHQDLDFQRLQQITRMKPFDLIRNDVIKYEFFILAGGILTFVTNWEDNRIGPNIMCDFSIVWPSQEALNKCIESIKHQLQNDLVTYRLALERDKQRTRSTNAEYGLATEQSIKALNKDLKEPSELVFFSIDIYECTINNSNGRYNQSQLAFMLDIPSQDTVDQFDYIPLWIAPAGTQIIDINQQNLPTRHQLTTSGWNEVLIGCAPERVVLGRGGL